MGDPSTGDLPTNYAKNTTKTITEVEKTEVKTDTTKKGDASATKEEDKQDKTTSKSVTTTATTVTTYYSTEFADSKGTDSTTGTRIANVQFTAGTPKEETKTSDDKKTDTKTTTTVSTKNNKSNPLIEVTYSEVSPSIKGDGSITVSSRSDAANYKNADSSGLTKFASWFGSYTDPNKASIEASLVELLTDEDVLALDSELAQAEAGKITYQDVYEKFVSRANDTARATTLVGANTTINALGAANISSTAKITRKLDEDGAKNFNQQMINTMASTTVQGEVTGANVNITANAEANYTTEKTAGLGDILTENAKISSLTKILPESLQKSKLTENAEKVTEKAKKLANELSVALGITNTDASVNVDSTAVVSAHKISGQDTKDATVTRTTGGNVKINSTASSTTTITMSLKPAEQAVEKAQAKDADTTSADNKKQAGTEEAAAPTADADKKTGTSTTTTNKSYNVWLNGGFVWVESSSKANTNVVGSVTSAADTEVSANTVNSVTTKLTIAGVDKTKDTSTKVQAPAYLNAAVALINQEESANVTVGSDSITGSTEAPLLNAAGKLKIASASNVTTDSTLGVQSDDSEAVSTSVNIIGVDTAATTNLYGTVKGAGDTSITATNTIDKYKAITNNAFGKEDTEWQALTENAIVKPFVKAASGDVTALTDLAKTKTNKSSEDKKKSDTKTSDTKTSGTTDTKAKLLTAESSTNDEEAAPAAGVATKEGTEEKKTKDGTSEKTTTTNTGWNQYFDIGASVLVTSSTNEATVNLNPGVTVNGGTLAVGANVQVKDTWLQAVNLLVNGSDKTKLMASAAVAVDNMTNTATVNVADATTDSAGTHKVTLNSAGKVAITSGVDNSYQRVNTMVNDIKSKWEDYKNSLLSIKDMVEKDVWDPIENDIKTLAGIVTDLENLDTSDITKMENTLESDMAKLSSVETSISNLKTQLNKTKTEAMRTYSTVTGKKGEKLIEAVKNIVTASNYANLYTSASSASSSTDKSANLAVTGNVGIQNIHNTATTTVGQGAIVNTNTKADGTNSGKYAAASVTANVDAANVLVAGKWGIIPRLETTSGAYVGIGGTVGVQNSYSNSDVTIKNGVAINNAGAIDVTAKNSAMNIGIVLGGAKTDTVGITGMVSYMGGESNSVVNVDDDANLTATRYYDNTDDLDKDGKSKGTKSVKEVGTGAVNITSANSTILTSVTGDVTRSGAASVGASVGVISYDVFSQALVKDLDGSSAAPTGSINAHTVNVGATNSGVINNLAIAGASASSASENSTSSESSTSSDKDSNSEKGGTSINLRDKSSSKEDSSAAPAADSKADTPSLTADNGDAAPAAASSDTVELDALTNTSEGKTTETVDKGEDSTVKQADLKAINNDTQGSTDAEKKENQTNNEKATDEGADKDKTKSQNKKDSAVKLALAASVTWNDVNSKTEAELSGIKVNMTDTVKSDAVSQYPDAYKVGKNVNVSALDTTYIGSYSGAMALTKSGTTDGKTKFQGNLSGAVAVNDIIKNTSSTIGSGTISGALNVNNNAENSGTQVAAGLSLGIQTGQRDTSGFDLSASGSFNYIESTVEANIQGASKDNKAIIAGDSANAVNVNNTAYDKDIQVAGGVTVNYAKTNVDIGASIAVNKVTNNIAAAITNAGLGSADAYVGDVNNIAASKLTQVGGALTVGITASKKGYVTVTGAVVGNTINNTLDADTSGSTIYAKSFTSQAADGKLENDTTGNSYTEGLQTLGFDLTGSDAITQIGSSDTDLTTSNGVVVTDSSKKAQYTSKSFSVDEATRGNLSVGAALGLSVNTLGGNGITASAGVVVSDVTNKFTSMVDNSSITTKEDNAVEVNAAAKTNMIGVAAGVAVSAKKSYGFTGAGSAVLQSINNDTKAIVQNSTLTTDKTDITVKNEDQLITFAGQINGSQNTVTGGLTWAQNTLNNTAGAYLYGTDITAVSASGTALKLAAENTSSAYAIAAGIGVGVNSYVNLNGAYATNRGKDNTEAVADAYTDSTDSSKKKNNSINSAKQIDVTATDSSTRKGIAGTIGVGAGSYVSLGGNVVINNIGSGADDKQLTRAALNNTSITSAGNSLPINVETIDNSDFLTLALGATVTAGKNFALAGTGSVAITNNYKNVTAEMEDTSIDAATDIKKAAVTVNSANTAKLITSADSLSVGASSNAGVGIAGAVAVINSDDDTNAAVSGGTQNVKQELVKANSNENVLDIAIGVGVGGSGNVGVGIAGSVINNNIGNDTNASLSGSTVTADGSVGVIANSNSTLRTYTGALDIAASGSAAVGIGGSVAVNKLTSSTIASISGANITAFGNDDGFGSMSFSSKDSGNNYHLKSYSANGGGSASSSDATRNGVVVDADSSEKLVNVVINGGIAGSGSVAVGLNGSVGVDTIQGETTARVEKSNINSQASTLGDKQNVEVNAHDYTDSENDTIMASIDASASAAVGLGAGVAINNYDHAVNAEIIGDSANQKKYTVNGKKLNVNAFNNLNALTTVSGVVVDGSAYFSLAGVGNIDIQNVTSSTAARVDYIDSLNDGITVEADHVEKLEVHDNLASASGAIAGVSLGVSYDDLQEESKTTASLNHSSIKHQSEDSADTVKANNDVSISNQIVGVAASVSLGAVGQVGAQTANARSIVKAEADGSEIGYEDSSKKAASFTVQANNNFQNTYSNVLVGASSLGGVVVGFMENTIDTQVTASVNNTKVKANTVDINAVENRNITGTGVDVAVGGLAVNYNVLNVAMGAALDDDTAGLNVSAGGETFSGNQSNVRGKLQSGLNDANNQSLTQHGTTLTDADTKTVSTYYSGGGNNAGVGVTISGSDTDLQADNAMTIKAQGTTNGVLTVGGGTLDIAGVALSYANVNNQSEISVGITDAKLQGGSVAITSLADGGVSLATTEVNVTGAGYNGTVAKATNGGTTSITLENATVASAGNISAQANNTMSTSAKATEVTVAGAAVDNIKVLSKDTSKVNIKVDNSSLLLRDVDATQTSLTGTVDILANKANQVTSELNSVSVSALGIGIISAEAEEDGDATIALTGSNAFRGNTVNIKADNATAAKASNPTNVNVSLASYNTNEMKATAEGSAYVSINDGSSFAANTVNISAAADKLNNQDTVSATMNSVMVAVAEGLYNKAITSNRTDASVILGDAEYHSRIWDSTAGAAEDVDMGTDLNVSATTDNGIFAESKAFDVALAAYAITRAEVTNATNASVSINGSNSQHNRLKSLTVNTNEKSTVNESVTGIAVGGGVVQNCSLVYNDSSYISSNSNISITGHITTAKDLTVNANTENKLNLASDGAAYAVLSAAVADFDSNATHNAQVNFKNADIVSGGAVNITAVNNTNFQPYDNKEFTMQGKAGALIAGFFGDYYNKIDNEAHVTTDNARITANGAMTIAAKNNVFDTDNGQKTTGVNSNVYGLSVGLASATVLTVTEKITNDSGVSISNNSALNTASTNDDLIISAADEQVVVLDSKGQSADKVGGAGYVDLTANLYNTRNNTITIDDSLVHSNHDVKLWSGAKSDGTIGEMSYLAEVYSVNDNLIPCKTQPAVYSTYNAKGATEINSGSKVIANRNVELYDDIFSGSEYMVYKEWYDWFQGENKKMVSQTGEVDETSTTAQNVTNYIQVDGRVIAGSGSDINVTIGKESNNNQKEQLVLTNEQLQSADDNGAYELVSFDDFYDKALTISSANDVLSKDEFKLGTDASTGNNYVELPSMASTGGGDIVIYTPVLTSNGINGSGSLEAYGGGGVTVTNNTNLELRLNDITVDSKAGGNIYTHGTANNVRTITTGGTSSAKDIVITNNNTLNSYAINGNGDLASIQSDIVVQGTINSTQQDVHIRNVAGDIKVTSTGDITGKNTYVQADKGSIVMEYTSGMREVGGSSSLQAPEDATYTVTYTDGTGVVTKSGLTYAEKEQLKNDITNWSFTLGTVSTQTYQVKYKYVYFPNDDKKHPQFAETGWSSLDKDAAAEKIDDVKDANKFDDVEVTTYEVKDKDGKVTSSSYSVKYEYDGDKYETDKYADKTWADILANGMTSPEVYAKLEPVTLTYDLDGTTVTKSYPTADVANYYNIMKTYLKKRVLSEVMEPSKRTDVQVNGSMLAGNKVTIAADTVNVNGNIQSGYKEYRADLSKVSDLEAKIQTIDANWIKDGSKALSDSLVDGNRYYMVSEGGTDGSDSTVYNVAVYYNPSTKTLVLPNIDGKGGNATIQANTIKNSQNGDNTVSIADGTYNIYVNNNSNYAIDIGKLKVNDIVGQVNMLNANGTTQIDNVTRNDDGNTQETGSKPVSNIAVAFFGDYANNSTVDVKSGGTINISDVVGNDKDYAAADNKKVKKGSVKIEATAGDVNQAEHDVSGNDISVSASGSVTNKGTYNAIASAAINAGENINNTASITATQGYVSMTAGNDITNTAAIEAKADITAEAAKGSITNSGAFKAGDNVSIKAAVDINNTASITATNGYASMTAGNDITNTAAIEAKTYITAEAAKGSITNSGAFKAGDNVSIKAAEDINNTASITATNGYASMTAGNDITNTAAIEAKTDITAEATKGSITNSGDLSAGDNVSINAAVDINNTASITATNGYASMTAGNDITNTAAIEAKTYITAEAAKGSVTNSGDLSAGDNVSIKAAVDINNSANITASAGYVREIAGGNITNEKVETPVRLRFRLLAAASSPVITAGDYINVQAEKNVTNTFDLNAVNNIDVTATESDVKNTADIKTTAGAVSIAAGNDVTNDQGNIISEQKTVSIKAGQNVNNLGDLVDYDKESIQAATGVSIEAAQGTVKNTAEISTYNGNIDVTAGTDVINHATIIVGNLENIELTKYSTGEGNIKINAGRNVINQYMGEIQGVIPDPTVGILTGTGNVDVKANEGSIFNGSQTYIAVEKAGNMTWEAGGKQTISPENYGNEIKTTETQITGIYNDGDGVASSSDSATDSGNIKILAHNGDITNKGKLLDTMPYEGTEESTGNVQMISELGSILNTQKSISKDKDIYGRLW